MNLNLSANVWRFIFGLVGAALAYSLVQTDLVLDPIVKNVIVVAVGVLAALTPPKTG